MILKELHLTDALGTISIFLPLTHNGEVRILTWPQVIDISKIRDIQIVGTSGLIKFWKIEKILLRTVAVARAYTFLEVRSRDSTWWPDLMWPRHKNFTTDVKLINENVCQVWLRCSLSFLSYPWKTTGGGGKMTPPPPTRAKVKYASSLGILLVTMVYVVSRLTTISGGQNKCLNNSEKQGQQSFGYAVGEQRCTIHVRV